MDFQHGGKTYGLVIGSDVVRDGVYLDVSGAAEDVYPLLEIFYSDVTHNMTVNTFAKDIPLDVIEWAISIAKSRLLPVPDVGALSKE